MTGAASDLGRELIPRRRQRTHLALRLAPAAIWNIWPCHCHIILRIPMSQIDACSPMYRLGPPCA